MKQQRFRRIVKGRLVKRIYSLMALSLLIPMFNFLVVSEASAITDNTDNGDSPTQCTQSIDTVIIMDLSNSMGECTGVDFSEPLFGANESMCSSVGGVWDGTLCMINLIDPSGLDRSACEALNGTWTEPRLDQAKDLANYYINNLVDSVSPNDYIGLVSFAGDANIEVDLGDETAAVVSSALAGLSSGQGGTNLSAALNTALDMLSGGQDGADKKILLFSDGDPTLPEGIAEAEVVTAYTNAASQGVKIYAFDMNIEDDATTVMEDMATPTNGGYYTQTATTADLDEIYDSNKNIDCPGTVVVCKQDAVSEEYLDGWEIQLEKVELDNDVLVASGVTGDSAYDYPQGCVIFSDVEPGDYHIFEINKPGWVKVEPAAGHFEFTVMSGFDNSDDPFVFVNRYEKGTLTICKQEDLNGDGQLQDNEPAVFGWTFYLGNNSYTDGADGDIEDGCVTIDDLDYGVYNVSEEDRAGWAATGASGNGTLESDGSITVEVGENNPAPTIYFLNKRETAVYCGDGEVNQDWEQCDGEAGCLDTCQWKEQNECSDLVLARVNIDDVKNWGNGNMSDKIYLGTSDYSIPAGTWFALYWNGTYFTDPDIVSYEDVPGLAVQRLNGSVRVVLYGSTTNEDKEHVDGNIEFYNASVTDQRSDDSGNNRLEKGFDGNGVGNYNAGDDEVWLQDGKSYFWLTTTIADDGYYTDWEITEDCDNIIKVCKYDTEGTPLPFWEMHIKSGNNLVVNGGFESPLVTAHNNKWQLFDSSQVGWTVAWREDGIEDEPVVELQSSNLWTPYEGNQYAELDSHYYNPSENPPRASVSISQNIPTVPGRRYTLSFVLSPRPGRPASDNRLKIEFGPIIDITSAIDGTGKSDTDWRPYSYSFLASATSTLLRFTDLGTANSLGTFIDNVAVYESVSGQTGENGCVEFKNMPYGSYHLTENLQPGWQQVEPVEGFYEFDFNEDNSTPVFNFINEREVPKGEITVCKYYDYDNDGEYDPQTFSDVDAPTFALTSQEYDYPLNNWVISLNDGEYTGETGSGENDPGCYTFIVPFGQYTVTEEPPAEESNYHWIQTYPGGDESQTVTIDIEDNFRETIYFLNVKADIWGCKYDDEQNLLGGWQVNLYQPSDAIDEWSLLQSTVTETDQSSPNFGCYYFANLADGPYRLDETLIDGWSQLQPQDGYYELNLGDDEDNPYDFINQEGTTGDSGGGGCTTDCGSPGGGTPTNGGGSTSNNSTGNSTGTPVEEPTVKGFTAQTPEIVKTVNKVTVNPGETITYNVSVTNSGDIDLTGVKVTDTLPTGFVFVDTQTANKTWEIGVLPANSTQNFTYDVKVDAGVAAGEYANKAVLLSNEFDPFADQAIVNVVPVKVLGYEKIPETGGDDSNSFNSLLLYFGLIMMVFGITIYRKVDIDEQA